MRLRVDLAYDGTPFHGFARQPDLATVQGTLEGALSRVLGQDLDVTCAGRTDRGVHATAQVVHLDLDPDVPAAARALDDLGGLRQRLDHLCGPAVTIWRVRETSPEFDARFSATERRYRYRIADQPTLHPLRRFDTWHLGRPLAIGPMRAGAAHLLGQHDFAALCRKPAEGHTVRRIDRLAVARLDGLVEVAVRGPAFCHQQVRSLTGILVEVGLGSRPPEWVADVLAAADRSRAPRVAPPAGLTLERVAYGRRWPAAPPPFARRGASGR